MVWGAFCEQSVSEISFVVANQNAQKYTRNLETYLLRSTRKTYNGTWVFQQDNASVHTEKVTNKWFKDHNVNVLDWPARSPDLNPIENLWGLLARPVYANGRQFESINSLKHYIVSEWAKIDQTICYKLARSMSH